MSEVKVNKISPRSGTGVQLGDSGDKFTVPSGSNITIDLGASIVNDGTATGFATTSPEVYGFSKNAGGALLITTTGGGVDNISKAKYASFDDVLFAGTGFVWSIDSDGNLITTI